MPELAPNPDRQPQRPKTFATECLKSLLQLAPHVDPATVVPPEASAVEQTSRRDAENSGEHLIECALVTIRFAPPLETRMLNRLRVKSYGTSSSFW